MGKQKRKPPAGKRYLNSNMYQVSCSQALYFFNRALDIISPFFCEVHKKTERFHPTDR